MLPQAIARAQGALSASYKVALPALPRQWHEMRVTCQDIKYGG